MQGYPDQKAAQQYLAQRLATASPEQLVAILLEGGQKYLRLALDAMKANDIPHKVRYVNRVSEFIMEMSLRLNRKDGSEVVTNLDRIYRWWTEETYDSARKNQAERMELVLKHMGEMRATWDERHQMNIRSQGAPISHSSLDLMVG